MSSNPLHFILTTPNLNYVAFDIRRSGGGLIVGGWD